MPDLPRQEPDGTLIFPNRGNPPPDIPGYTRDPGDKFIFKPTWIECKHRDLKHRYRMPCGRFKLISYCNKFEHEVTQYYCANKCKEPDKT